MRRGKERVVRWGRGLRAQTTIYKINKQQAALFTIARTWK